MACARERPRSGWELGTIFTLFVVPSVYVLVARDHRNEGTRKVPLAAEAVDGPATGRGTPAGAPRPQAV